MDYKEEYYKLMAAVSDAVDMLIKAQRECEEAYISDGDEEHQKRS